jgi:hypothetical protein
MIISTWELAATGGEALLIPQFSSLLLCEFATVGRLEASYLTIVIVWFISDVLGSYFIKPIIAL